jgi:hypothetical protein
LFETSLIKPNATQIIFSYVKFPGKTPVLGKENVGNKREQGSGKGRRGENFFVKYLLFLLFSSIGTRENVKCVSRNNNIDLRS